MRLNERRCVAMSTVRSRGLARWPGALGAIQLSRYRPLPLDPVPMDDLEDLNCPVVGFRIATVCQR